MLPSRASLFGLDGAHGWNIDIVARGTVVSLVRQLAGWNEGFQGCWSLHVVGS